MLADIDKNTVDFAPNFDDRLQEPTVLPARIPNLLVNGSSGIAVGMATRHPAHNLREVVDACIYGIDHPDAEVRDLMPASSRGRTSRRAGSSTEGTGSERRTRRGAGASSCGPAR